DEIPNSAISEIHVLYRLEVLDLRELLVERLPRRQELEERRPRHRLEDQPIPLLPEEGLIARELKVPGYPHCLAAPVPEQAHDSFRLHDVLPAAGGGSLCSGIG